MSQTGIERRRWPRIVASSLGDLSATVASIPDAKLLNLSRGGALFEVAAHCPVRASMRVKLERAGCEPIVAAGNVVWGNVMSITDGRIRYRVAVAFEQAIPEVALVMEIDRPSPVCDAPSMQAASCAETLHVPADDRVEQLQKKLDERTGELLSVSSLLDSLTERLRTCNGFRAALQDQLETERRQREDERSTHVCQVADALARAEALQATLDACQHQHAESLRERDARHEAVVADLIQASNEQQQEYHRLLDQSIAAEGEQRCRAEQFAQELARRDAQLQEHRDQSEARCRDLEARLEAAETLRATYDRKHEALQRQTEKLLMMFRAVSESECYLRDELAPVEQVPLAEGVRQRAIALVPST